MPIELPPLRFTAVPFPEPGEPVCVCEHAVSIHVLEDMFLMPEGASDDPDWNFAWRMPCQGAFVPSDVDPHLIVAAGAYTRCECTTVTFKER